MGLTMNEQGLLQSRQQATYIPAGNNKLRQRLLVISHASAAGHRGQDTTRKHLKERVWWPTMQQEAMEFVRACLICVKTKGGAIEPPPLGQSLQGFAPVEAIHMDFVSTSPGKGDLVIKCGFMGFCMLLPEVKYSKCVNLWSNFCMLVSVMRWVDQATSRFRLCGEGGVTSVRGFGDHEWGVNAPDSESCLLRCFHLLWPSLMTRVMSSL
jgi:hypothetical protein